MSHRDMHVYIKDNLYNLLSNQSECQTCVNQFSEYVLMTLHGKLYVKESICP